MKVCFIGLVLFEIETTERKRTIIKKNSKEEHKKENNWVEFFKVLYFNLRIITIFSFEILKKTAGKS